MYIIPQSEQENMKALVMKYTSLTPEKAEKIFTKSFFNLGRLNQTPYEIDKAEQIVELKKRLEEIQLLDRYLETFNDILFFPLAIENKFGDVDSNVKITVTVKGREVILPDFINPAIEAGQAAEIYRLRMPLEMFTMPTSDGYTHDDVINDWTDDYYWHGLDDRRYYDDISYEIDMGYKPDKPYSRNSYEAAKNFILNSGGLMADMAADIADDSNPLLGVSGVSSGLKDDVVTDRDYFAVMKKYIATPVIANAVGKDGKPISEFSFSIKSLEVGEKKWLAGMIAVRKNNTNNTNNKSADKFDDIRVRYEISSELIVNPVEGEIAYDGKSR